MQLSRVNVSYVAVFFRTYKGLTRYITYASFTEVNTDAEWSCRWERDVPSQTMY